MSTTFARHRRRVLTVTAVAAVAAIALSGCASAEQAGKGSAGSGSVTLDSSLVNKAEAAAKRIAGNQKLSGSIEYIGPNGGREGAILQALYEPFTKATGVTVKYTGTQDTNNIVQSRVQAGKAPDVADLSLGVAKSYAAQGKTLDVGKIIGDEQGDYSKELVDDASLDGKQFGVFQGFSNFMLWYNPKTYTGPKDPTWQQISDYTDATAAKGTTPWCIAEESGAGSGFPGAQMIEALFAKKYGPEKLEEWGSGKLAWTSPEVKDAWQMFGSVATNDKKVNGGVTGSLADPIATGSSGLVSNPPKCQLDLWGSWVPGLIGADAKAGKNLDFMPVPAADPQYQGTEIFQTTVSTPFNDTPAVRAFVKYVASPEAQTLLASANQWTVANTKVPTSTYSDTLLQQAAKTYFGNDVQLSVGPNSLADAATSAAFYKGVIAYLKNPSSLDSVLAGIDSAAHSS